MSLNGINNNPLLSSLPAIAPRPAGAQPNGAPANGVQPNGQQPSSVQPGAAQRSERTPAARPSIASTPSAVPAEAPPGTDPALWSVLTSEERTFFSKTAALGPLTYGRIKNATLPTPPAMRGGRLDVRA